LRLALSCLFQEPAEGAAALRRAQPHAHAAQLAEGRVGREGVSRDTAGHKACGERGAAPRVSAGSAPRRAGRTKRTVGVFLVVQLELVSLAWQRGEAKRRAAGLGEAR